MQRQVCSHKPEAVAVLGCRVHCVDMEQALTCAEAFIADREPHHIVTADASAIVIAQRDPEFRSIINTADLVVPDSNGVVWACRRLGYPIRQRVPGVDLMDRLCQLGARRGYSAFLFGSQPGVAEEAASRLQTAHPGLRVAGTMHGYIAPDEEPALLRQIAESRPDMLFVALGIPRQEKWIRRHQQELGVPLAVGVGGSFDCLSGRVKRAPVWFQRHGLEWAYRLMRNPRKVPKVATLPRFVLMVMLESLRGQYARSQPGP